MAQPDHVPSVQTVADGITRHPPGFRLRRGRNWFFIGLTYASYYFNRYNLPLAGTTFCRAFGFTNTQFGMIDSSRSISYAFGLIVNGLLSDRLGGRVAMAVGGYGTAVLNLAFGLVAYYRLAGPLLSTLGWFMLIRGMDGYIQAFGAPGMVKMNTAWFARPERGRFAGIFGLMINLGRYINNTISPYLLAGFTIWNYSSPKGLWQMVFFVPAGFIVVTTTVMLILAKNTPDEAGYAGAVVHEDNAGDDTRALPMAQVFRKIITNKFVWLTAGAYFCTGGVRVGVDTWFTKCFQDVHHVDLRSHLYQVVAFLIPTVAAVGSIGSGYLSDLVFRGRRAPVAAILYFVETAIILAGAQTIGSPYGLAVTLILVALTCNSTHSILGTAAPMDIGGRKMAGFATGFIDSWQYVGAALAGVGFGKLIDAFGWGAWLYGMAPFGLLGGGLMIIMSVSEHRSKGDLQSG